MSAYFRSPAIPHATIRETTNHTYSTDDLLGRGATCEVYRGINRETGDHRALKIFLQRARNTDTAREVKALTELQHKNVVIFYSVEQDKSTARPVVVTELCEDGSLQDVLNTVNYKYGLDEEEFQLVFKHLLDGIRHLRSNGFVHRDIKPGNILRCIDENGRSLYKLSDFGTARLLDDDDQFMSLVGTEEYLHPNLYHAAFMNPRGMGAFDAKVDLWSLGATLYHCATGTVPFRPYSGREDKRAMYEMLTQRPKGAIGGVQLKLNGNIHWIKELPPASSLSRGMKQLITPLLLGLFEIEEEKVWTFDKFFKEGELILNKTSIDVLAIMAKPTWLYKIYLDPGNSFEDLQKQLEEQTDIRQEDQSLFYQNNFYDGPTDMAEGGNSPISSLSADQFPKTSLSRPFILLSRQIFLKPTTPTTCAYLEEIESDRNLDFSPTMDLFYDIQIANMIGGHLNIIHKQVLIASSLQQHIVELEQKQRQSLKQEFNEAKMRRREMMELHHEMKHATNEAFKKPTEEGLWPVAVDMLIVDNESLLSNVDDGLSKALKIIPEQPTFGEEDWCYGEAACSCKSTRSFTVASTTIDRMAQRRKTLSKRTKTSYDGLQHKADKKQLMDLKVKTVRRWKEHCLPKTRCLQSKMNMWSSCYIQATDHVRRSLKLLEELRQKNLEVLKLLRKESSISEDDVTAQPPSVELMRMASTHQASVLSTDFPEVYRIGNVEDEPMSFLQS